LIVDIVTMDIILHLTHDCQLSCSYCYGGRKRASAMTMDVARRAIDILFNQSACEPLPLISFFGGEPLLQLPMLKECVAYAEARREKTGRPFKLAITTNGLAINNTVAEYFSDKQIEPTLSFDGVYEAQNACRRFRDGKSSFSDSRNAMLMLKQYFPDLSICAVVTPKNVQYLPESIDFFIEAGIRRLLLNPDFFAQWDEQHLDLWRCGYEHAAERFEDEFHNGRVFHVNFITAKIVTRLKGGYEPCDCCDFGQKEIAIAPSGNIYPCQRMVGEDSENLGLMGNVFDGFDKRICKELAVCRTISSYECLSCDLRFRCRNWCSCVNHHLTGRFDQTGAIVCFHEQMAIEIADRIASRLFQEKNKTFMETFYMENQISDEWV
jgi:uncharacterized protein